MRVIRPAALDPRARRRALVLAGSMIAVGVLAGQLTLVLGSAPPTGGVLAATSALGLGIGCAWLVRTLQPNRTRALVVALADLLAPTLDDSYTMVVAPRLPVRDGARLDAVLVGPAGVRVITARDWEGRYRVRGRAWEFDARGRRGWIRCRTNPSYDAVALAGGFSRWAARAGFRDVAARPTIAFPRRSARIVLEEPEDEVVTADNAPWWANTMGRMRRLDPAQAALLVAAILETSEEEAGLPRPARAEA